MCLTNFLPAKKTCKKAVYTSHEVILQRQKSHNLRNASLKHLLASIKCGKYIPQRIQKWNGETSCGCFAVSFFGEPAKGSKGVELPCKFRMCPDRVHPVQNGMPFCETCLSSPPRFQRFLRGLDAWKAASERALLFRICLPSKIFQTLQGDDSGFVIFHRGWVSGEKSLGYEVADLLLLHLPEI